MLYVVDQLTGDSFKTWDFTLKENKHSVTHLFSLNFTLCGILKIDRNYPELVKKGVAVKPTSWKCVYELFYDDEFHLSPVYIPEMENQRKKCKIFTLDLKMIF